MKIKIIIFAVLSSILLASCKVPMAKKEVSPWVMPTQAKFPSTQSLLNPTSASKAVSTPISIGPCEYIPVKGIQGIATSLQNSHILYLSTNSQNQKDELWIASLSDGTVKQLHGIERLRSDFGFLKDGFHFAMLQYDWKVVISNIADLSTELVDVDKSLLNNFRPYSFLWQKLQEGNPKFTDPSIGSYSRGEKYSPDGKKIASYKNGDSAFVIIDVETKKETPVLYTPISKDGGTETIEGEWTEDAQYFLFFRTWKEGINTYSQLLSVDRNGNNLQPLMKAFNDEKWVTSLKISPDQKTVVFSISQLRDLSKSLIGILDRITGQIKIFERNALVTSQVDNGTFVWSPDSKWVAYLFSEYPNQIDIHITDIASGKTFCITHDDSLERFMDWK